MTIYIYFNFIGLYAKHVEMKLSLNSHLSQLEDNCVNLIDYPAVENLSSHFPELPVLLHSYLLPDVAEQRCLHVLVHVVKTQLLLVYLQQFYYEITLKYFHMPPYFTPPQHQLLFTVKVLQLLDQTFRASLYDLIEWIEVSLHRKNSLHYHFINFKILYWEFNNEPHQPQTPSVYHSKAPFFITQYERYSVY